MRQSARAKGRAAPAVRLLAPFGAQDRARRQHLGAQYRQAWEAGTGNVALEVGDQVERKKDQAEGYFGWTLPYWRRLDNRLKSASRAQTVS